MRTAAEQLAAIHEVQARHPATAHGENQPYTGPEPIQEYLTGTDADRRADTEQARYERQWEALT